MIEPRTGFPLIVPIVGVGRANANRSMDFSKLAVWGNEARLLVLELVRSCAGLNPQSTVTYSRPVKNYLLYCVEMSEGRAPSTWQVEEWRYFTNSFITSVKSDRKKSSKTINRIRNFVAAFLAHLWDRGIAPRFSIQKGVPEGEGGKRLGIGNAVPSNEGAEGLSASDKLFLDELSSSHDIGDPAQYSRRTAMLQERIRTHAERSARIRWAHFKWADEVVRNPAGFDVDGFIKDNVVSVRPLVMRDGWEESISTPSAALKIADRLGPTILCRSFDEVAYRKLGRKFNVAEVRNALFPTAAVLVPFTTILQIDLKNEPSSVVTMATDCCHLSDEKSVVIINWDKLRSGRYKEKDAVRPIGTESSLDPESDERIEAFRVVGAVNAMRERLSKYVVPQSEGDLFISFTTYDKPYASSTLTTEGAMYAFDRFRESDPVLKLFAIARANFRSSALEQVFFDSGGNLAVVQREAGHRNMGVSQGYVRGKAGEILDANKAREVHQFMVVTATRNRTALQEKLGIERDAAKQLAKAAADAGLFGYQLETDEQSCDEKVSEFVSWMIEAEHVLAESVPIAAQIISFEAHLRSEAKALRDHPSWETTWVYVLLYLNAAIAEMRPDIRRAGELMALDQGLSYMEIN